MWRETLSKFLWSFKMLNKYCAGDKTLDAVLQTFWPNDQEGLDLPRVQHLDCTFFKQTPLTWPYRVPTLHAFPHNDWHGDYCLFYCPCVYWLQAEKQSRPNFVWDLSLIDISIKYSYQVFSLFDILAWRVMQSVLFSPWLWDIFAVHSRLLVVCLLWHRGRAYISPAKRLPSRHQLLM